MRILLVLPILVPLATAIALLFARTRPRLQQALSVSGSAALLVAAGTLLAAVWRHGIHATQAGGWPAPFGITLVADLFSATMVVLAAFMGFTTVIYSLASIDPGRQRYGYHPLLHVLLMGVCGAFLTGDMFNLFVWFEVMLIASFVLVGLGGEKAQLEGAIKYVTLNLVSSAIFLSAIGILYGLAGTLNMADLAGQLKNSSRPGLVTTVAMLFLVTFGIKAAVFPLFFWLPASYHTPPVAVSAIFAGLLTKVGVYAIIRAFTLLFVNDVGLTHTLILIISGLTMVTGVLGAAAQNDFRRILSFHIVSQIGYMVMGVGLFTPLAVAGSVFYIIHHIIVKTNLFLVSGVVRLIGGSYRLADLGGIYRGHPWLSALFLIPALSLAGVPPLSGFWAKLLLVWAGFEAGQSVIVATALMVGLLTLFSMTKIWSQVFWEAPPQRITDPADSTAQQTELIPPYADRRLLFAPIIALAAATVMIGLGAEPIYMLARRAAEQLMNPEGYIKAVLGAAS